MEETGMDGRAHGHSEVLDGIGKLVGGVERGGGDSRVRDIN